MKKSVDILGLPVISICEGSELGTAKMLVIDPVQGAVAAIAVEDGKWYLGAKLLPFPAVSGIGENAITVESSDQILSLANAPEMEKFLAADVKVIGAKVLTKTGRFQGKITEITIDENGKIASCELEETNGEKAVISGARVITFSKEVVIISETDIEGPASPSVRPAVVAPPAPAAAAPERPVVVTAAPEQRPAAPTPAPAAAPATPPAATENHDDSAKKFDDKQRKYLLGKKASRRIETDNGVVIVDNGGEITEEVIQKAKLAGKFVELSMSI
ncbi:MAG: PRC-barrel domain-containing protein [Negativicutes bacterium]|nr:PRC-barrel domain-containing protein [Negativicutes bacterium]